MTIFWYFQRSKIYLDMLKFLFLQLYIDLIVHDYRVKIFKIHLSILSFFSLHVVFYIREHGSVNMHKSY